MLYKTVVKTIIDIVIKNTSKSPIKYKFIN